MEDYSLGYSIDLYKKNLTSGNLYAIMYWVINLVDILIIEDDEDAAGLIRDFLLKDGYSCKVCGCGKDGLAFLRDHDARIVLLDLMLPDVDGFAVRDKIHTEKNIPVIIVSARSDKIDKLFGLSLGADHYIEKPFDMDILRAKIAALYRRHYNAVKPEQHRLIVGELVIDLQKRTASLKGKPLELNQKEFDLLSYLAKNNGKVLYKEKLFRTVWGGFASKSTLMVHINRLRNKIEADSATPKHILNVRGVGYKYVE